ncbi:MAG: hypothetical protein WBC44_05810 [Planctomycetaceae bacterium]
MFDVRRVKWLAAVAIVGLVAYLVLTPTLRYMQAQRLLRDAPEEGVNLTQQPLWPDWFWRPIAGEWAQPLAPITKVQVWKSNSQPRIDDRWPERIAAISTMTELDLSRGAFTEDEILRLIEAEPDSLEVLFLNRSDVGDRTLAALAELDCLERLHISETLVTEDGIDRLRHARPEMKIVADPLTRRGLGELRRRTQVDLDRLRRRVWGMWLPSDVTVEEAAGLSRIPNPIWVGLRNPLRMDILKVVAGLPNLRRFELSRSGLTGETRFAPELFDEFDDSRSLHELTLNHVPLTDEHLPHIAAIESLRAVDLAGTQVTGEGLRRFRERRPDVEVRSELSTVEVWSGFGPVTEFIAHQPRWRGPNPVRIPSQAERNAAKREAASSR